MDDAKQILALVEDAVPRLSGPRPTRWMARLDAAFGAVGCALRECLASGDETGLRIASALGKFWWVSGRAAEGKRWLDAFLEWPSEPAARLAGLIAAGGAAYALADYAAAMARFQEARPAGGAAVLNQLGMVAREQCRFAEARSRHEEARGLFRADGDAVGEAWCVSNLGVVAFRKGDLPSAKSLHEEALERRRGRADERDINSSLGNLAAVARLQGDRTTATTLHRAALLARERLGDRWGVAGSLLNLALVAIDWGEFGKAEKLLAKAEATFAAIGDRLGLCEVRDARVLARARRGEPTEQALAAAVASRAEIAAPHAPVFWHELRR